ncbi:galactokinase [Kordia periserrulae]|uniref:Galactokinase n=1 Tax=Kordia periserrulae TaxID=701523 RepID=A0A2T6BUG5_9FLAO|nr:galactokinase [Kordia periserrulae]PTX59703.1 galactokinase [Kordia periserrulae]
MDTALISKLKNSFQVEFQLEPLLIFSPGRINLIGEHVDYNDGFVFPAAVNKGIVLAIQKTDDLLCTAIASDFEESFQFNLNELEAIHGGGWRNYLIGVIKELQKLGKDVQPFHVLFGGNVPAGAGMSSSAALENAIVFGLNELFQFELTKKEMALISQQAEHNYVGVKCGIMDQFASMFGEADKFLLLDCRSLTYEPYKIDLNDYDLVLINTNVQHNLSDSTYNKRRALCERAALHFGEKALRDVSKEHLYQKQHDFTKEEFDMILYIVEEIERTKSAAKAINENNIERLGQLLYESHHGLSKQYQVSCDELDFLIDFAKASNVVIGARMMGGGFGGCTLNLIKKTAVSSFIESVSNAYQEQFGYNCTPINIKLSKGTHTI